MANHEIDLDQRIEMENIEQPENQALDHPDQYNIENQIYRDQMLWEVEDAIENVRRLPNLDHLYKTPVENDIEIIQAHDNTPRIIRYLDEE